MKIYHGSNIAIEHPKIFEGKYAKDFGEGFYCTELKEQSERWAKRHDTAIVNIYDFNPDNSLKIKRFEEMTEEWLDFIVDCRNGKKHNFDIVIGAMANDQVYNYIADFVKGIITREQFWILAKFKYPTHQICFCNDLALNCLIYIDFEKI
jgi:hypothetical protein